jgi:hypothetical protein
MLLFSPKRIIFSLVKSLPHFFCLAYITMQLTFALIRTFINNLSTMSKKQCFRQNNTNTNTNNNNSTFNQYYLYNNNLIYTRKLTPSSIKSSKLKKHKSFEEHYVYNVFNRITITNNNSSNNNNNVLMRLFKFNNPGNIFRYSTRVISTYTICFTVLFYMTCLISFYGSIFVDMLYLPSIYAHTLIVGALVTSFVCALQLCMSLLALKRHLTLMYKGIQQQVRK